MRTSCRPRLRVRSGLTSVSLENRLPPRSCRRGRGSLHGFAVRESFTASNPAQMSALLISSPRSSFAFVTRCCGFQTREAKVVLVAFHRAPREPRGTIASYRPAVRACLWTAVRSQQALTLSNASPAASSRVPPSSCVRRNVIDKQGW